MTHRMKGNRKKGKCKKKNKNYGIPEINEFLGLAATSSSAGRSLLEFR